MIYPRMGSQLQKWKGFNFKYFNPIKHGIIKFNYSLKK